MERCLISENFGEIHDACQTTKKQETEATGVENVPSLSPGVHEVSLSVSPEGLADVAEPQMLPNKEKKVGDGPVLGDNAVDHSREAKEKAMRHKMGQSLSDGTSPRPSSRIDKEVFNEDNLLSEVEALRASNAMQSESKRDLLAKLEKQSMEIMDLRNECQHLANEKEEQNEAWIKNVSDMESCHADQMAASLNAVQNELKEVKLSLETTKEECESLKEDRVKSLMLMSQTCSEKDELQAALGVCGMAEKNLKEESQDYTEVLTADLNTTNWVLAEARGENSVLLEKVSNQEQSIKSANEVNEELSKEVETLKQENKELQNQASGILVTFLEQMFYKDPTNKGVNFCEFFYQILAKPNVSGDRQISACSNSLFSEDSPSEVLDKLTAREYLKSYGIQDQARAKLLKEVLQTVQLEMVCLSVFSMV